MVGFVSTISKHFPDIQVVCFGEDAYENIQHESGPPLPSKEVLLEKILSDAKDQRVAELSHACHLAIIGGVISSALGTPHWYDTELEDQLNAIGAHTVVTPTEAYPNGEIVPYACREIVNGVTQPKLYKPHTYGQLQQVLKDGAMMKLYYLQNFNDKRDYVNNVCTTIAEVLEVTWSSAEP